MSFAILESTYNVAIPYAVTSLAIGTAGAVIAFASTSTAAAVSGVALALIGAYAFIGVVVCAMHNSNSPTAFKRDLGPTLLTFAGTAIADLIHIVAKVVIIDLVSNRNRS